MNTFSLLLSFLVLFSLANATFLKKSKGTSDNSQTIICNTGVSLQSKASGNYLNLQVNWVNGVASGTVITNRNQEPSYCVDTVNGKVQHKDTGLYVVAYGNNGYTCWSPNCTPSWWLQVIAVAQIGGYDWPWNIQTVILGKKKYYRFTLTSHGVIGALTDSNGAVNIQTYPGTNQDNQLWQFVSDY